MFAFEIASLLLLVAIIGAVVMAKKRIRSCELWYCNSIQLAI